MVEPAHKETPFWRTAAWVVATAAFVYAVLTVIGVRFMLDHENQIAKTILDQHLGAVAWVYVRILAGYLAAGLVIAFVLHPFVAGWKAAPLALLLGLLSVVYTLTGETHLLYGPTQTLFSSVRDRVPAWLRDPYEPWMIAALFGVFVLASLYRWSRGVPQNVKVAALAVIAVAVGVSLLPAAKAAPQGPTCFLLIATDSLRADHLHCNGYARPTSPHIDALAARGTLYERCYSQANWTVPSMISLMSGASVCQEDVALPVALEVLAEAVKGRGLATAGFTANTEILAAVREHPELVVRCSSEFPFFPGPQSLYELVETGAFGRVIEINTGFLHSSDLDPNKPINWKRLIRINGEYGAMGDLGLHACHFPFRVGWKPRNVRAVLNKIVPHRPDSNGNPVPCETWDNATLLCEAEDPEGVRFPWTLKTQRIAPGQKNTWYIEIYGTKASARFSTKNPKRFELLTYTGDEQAWQEIDLGYTVAFKTITGGIFEFGFSDSILQMTAAFFHEIAHGHPLRPSAGCATPDAAEATAGSGKPAN